MQTRNRSVPLFAVTVGLTLLVSPVVRTSAVAKDEEPPASTCDKFKKGSAAWKKCTGQKAGMTDQELYYSGYWLAKTGQYAAALSFLNQVTARDERVLTYIGFATRKLGDFETAMGFYTEALAKNPNYTVARAYLGEAHLGRGDVASANAQLSEIASRCGVGCVDHVELQAEIAKYMERKG